MNTTAQYYLPTKIYGFTFLSSSYGILLDYIKSVKRYLQNIKDEIYIAKSI